MGVVAGVDEGKDLGGGVGRVDELGALEHLGLEGAQERLGPGVVMRIGSGGHALAAACGGEQATELGAAIAGLGDAGLGLEGVQTLLPHEAAHALAGAVGDDVDPLAELVRVLLPRIIAAFF